jgi:hypothetical protein
MVCHNSCTCCGLYHLLHCRTVATNVFELQKGKWVIVLHQGGPLPSARFR